MSIENAQIIDIARFCIKFSAATNSSHIYRQLNLQNLSFFKKENANFLKFLHDAHHGRPDDQQNRLEYRLPCFEQSDAPFVLGHM